MTARVRTVTTWRCADCEATGDTDAGAARHAKREGHTTLTFVRPDREGD